MINFSGLLKPLKYFKLDKQSFKEGFYKLKVEIESLYFVLNIDDIVHPKGQLAFKHPALNIKFKTFFGEIFLAAKPFELSKRHKPPYHRLT